MTWEVHLADLELGKCQPCILADLPSERCLCSLLPLLLGSLSITDQQYIIQCKWSWHTDIVEPRAYRPRSGERACNSAYACRDGEVLVVTKNRTLPFSKAPSKMGQTTKIPHQRTGELLQLKGQRRQHSCDCIPTGLTVTGQNPDASCPGQNCLSPIRCHLT